VNHLQLKRKTPRSDVASNDNLPSETASDSRLPKGLSWAWVVLSGLATLLWLVGIIWAAVRLFLWVAG
jgi:hypothetical protein